PYYLDGKLFFSSTGHPGIGGFDIFNADWSGSGWSSPVNQGTPFNSSVDDLYFTVDSDGFSGALASNRPGTKSVKGKTCCNDIYIFQKTNVALDLLTTVLSEKQPLNGAKVQFFEIEDDKVINFDTRQKENGNKYTFLLNMDKAYKVVASREGYFPDSLTFNTQGLRQTQTIEKMFDLKAKPPEPPKVVIIPIKEPIRLNNIYYDFDDDAILTDAEKDLRFLQKLMTDYPDMVIELSSHTDSQGTTPYNRKLSQRRAESAKAWLVEKGIAEERIKPVGYGESKILNQCVNGVRCTDDEHRVNRRTEFQIIAGPKEITIEKEVLQGAEIGGEGIQESGKKN
ncbi:MAG: OmpA family protein, partial [Bacteroidota bacterium]